MPEWAQRAKFVLRVVLHPTVHALATTSDHHGRVVSCARRMDVTGLPWTAQTVPTPVIIGERRYGLGKAASGVATIVVLGVGRSAPAAVAACNRTRCVTL